MAEQDRPDAVPAVLNDLMDVDGTPTSPGDALRWSGSAWEPGAPGSKNGPLVSVFADTVNGNTVGQNSFSYTADNDYANWTPWEPLQEPDDAPGEWVADTGFQFTRQGLYSVSITFSPTMSAGTPDPASYILCFTGGNRIPFMPRAYCTPNSTLMMSTRITSGQFWVDQTAIDNQYPAGFYPIWVYARPAGTITLDAMYVETIIYQWLPDDHDPTWAFM